jgi:hypothetical protein
MADPAPTTAAAPTGVAKLGGVQEWWDGLGKEQQYALAGGLVGGGTFGALNMLRQGRRDRFKNFLSGLAVGGLGGAAAGYGGASLLDPKKQKPPADPRTDTGLVDPPLSARLVDRSGESVLSKNNLAEGGRQLGRSGLRVGAAAGAGAVGLPVLSAVKARAMAAKTPTPMAATRAGFTNRTNILGLGRMRNPLLGALMGGGIQTGREINNGPDE